jgi:DNA-binding CsgD family transcriptional regulator
MRGTDARLGRWLDLVGEVLRQPLVELPYREFTTELAATFDAYATCIHTVDSGREHVLHAQPADLTMARLEELRPFGNMGPAARWYRITRSTSPQTSGRVPPGIADRRLTGEWRRISRGYGVTEQICIPLHVADTEQRMVVAARPDRDFSEDDLDLAHRLQPVLVGLERQAAELARWRHCSTPAADDGGWPAVAEARLTARELTVLNLLAEGLTAAAIGRRLAISTRTVHKHLEHVYAKLGTGDRLTTVLRAEDAGLLRRVADPAERTRPRRQWAVAGVVRTRA